ncbi:MAG: right-handed parallel beta-helix repeat-containing protein, partial [Chitinophagales bacterium]
MQTIKQITPILCFFWMLFSGLHFNEVFAQADYYVNQNTPCTTGCDGTSWAKAFDNLQAAIDVAAANDEIWVAEGTYLPSKDKDGSVNPADNRDKTFYFNKDVKIYGGFPNTDNPSMADRDWENYPTILSGDFDNNDIPITDKTNADFPSQNNEKNAYTVVHTYQRSSVFTIDGFFIQGGNSDSSGGGMYNKESNPTLTNCIFSNNSGHNGGGMRNNLSNPTLTNCIFSNNSGHNGGGMDSFVSSPALTDCSFFNNFANYGGGMNNSSCDNIILTNCIFSNNSANFSGGGVSNSSCDNVILTDCSFFSNHTGSTGGGMYSTDDNITLINCGFSNNSASSGGGMYNASQVNTTLTNCSLSNNSASSGGGVLNTYQGNTTFTNCILWNNGSEIHNQGAATPTVTYSIVQGDYAGTGNLNQNPLFLDPVNNNLQIPPCSPAINAGNKDADLDGVGADTQTIEDIPTDLAGNTRVIDGFVDMGAYEASETVVDITVTITGDLEYCASDNLTTLDAGSRASYPCSNNEDTQTIEATPGTYT